MPLTTGQDFAEAARIIGDLHNPKGLFYSEVDAQWLAWNIPCEGDIFTPANKMAEALGEDDRSHRSTEMTGHVPGHGNVTLHVPDGNQATQARMIWVGQYEVNNCIVPDWTIWTGYAIGAILFPLRLMLPPGTVKKPTPVQKELGKIAKSVPGKLHTLQIFPRGFATRTEIGFNSLSYKVVKVDGRYMCKTIGFTVAAKVDDSGVLTSGSRIYPDWMRKELQKRGFGSPDTAV